MKKLLSILLCAALLLSTLVPAYAAPAQAALSDTLPVLDDALPVIVVRGLDIDGVTIDPGDGSSQPLINFDAGALFSAILKAAPGLLGLNTQKAIDPILDYASELCKYLACDNEGVPIYPSNIPTYPLALSNYPELLSGEEGYSESDIALTAADRYGADRTYYFAYDWRRNPQDNADDLAAMVNEALASSGKSKVNIVSASLGGLQTLAYLSEYGYEKVNKSIFLSSTAFGIYMASDLMCGRISFSGETLGSYLLSAVEGNAFGTFFIKALKSVGFLNLAASLANNFVEKNKTYITDKALRDIVGYLTPFWAGVLPEDYDQARTFIFGGHEEENAGFIAKTYEFQAIAEGRDALLLDAAENGVGIALVAGYNSPSIPIYSRAISHGDSVLDTAPMAGNATVAPFGQTLGDDYVPADPARLSPDRIVDLSTGLFPDATWVIKDGPHVGGRRGSDYANLIVWLIDCEGQPSVSANPLYPQFLQADAQQNLTPLT